MILPVIITSSREALESVPQSFRIVSLSLGASKWQTIRHSVLPHALPGILTGTILGLGRAAGETAPILFTVAAFYLPKLPQSVVRPDNGASLSFICHLHAGAGHSGKRTVWHCTCPADARVDS